MTWARRPKTVIICAGILVLASAASAQRQGPEPTGPNTEEWLQLRDPFWPVGYARPTEPDPAETKRQEIQQRVEWPLLVLRGLTRMANGRHIAILDGVGLAEAGDTVSVERDGLTYRWRIDEVTRRGIRTTRIDVREPRELLQDNGE